MKARTICFVDEVSRGKQSRDEIAKFCAHNQSLEGELLKPNTCTPWDRKPLEKRIV